jgi:sirohydrochlorin ferrochelatase
MTRPHLLAVSHGTSDAAGAAAIAHLVDAVAAVLPDVQVHSAFVDVQQPEASAVLDALEGPVVVVPLLLSRGFHVHHDLHGIVDARPDAIAADPLGPDARLAEILARRLPQSSTAPVILAVAGSRDPLSLTDAEGMASALERRLGRTVHLAYLAAREPDLPTALAAHPDAIVSTYLLAHGYFFDLTERQAGDRLTARPLLDGGPVPPPLIDLVVARYERAAAALEGVLA